MTETRYIPPKIRQCGNELRANKNTEATLSFLRENYPSITSYQTAVNRLRSYLIDTEEHHPAYNTSITQLESSLVDAYKASLGNDGAGEGNKTTLACIQFLYEFKGVPLRRQLVVLQKLKLGQMTLPCEEFGQALHQVPILPAYVEQVHLSPKEMSDAKQRSSESQHNRSSNVTSITNPNQVIKKCISIIRNESEPLEHLCVALALLTGRRTVEILLTGSLDPIPGSTHFAHFSGQVKTGLQQVQTVTADLPVTYSIPVLGSARVMSKKLLDIQALVQKEVGCCVTKELVNHRFSGRLSRAVKSLIHPELRFHDLRTLYALISFEAFKPHKYGLNGWVSRVLGHRTVNMSTHYTRMQIGSVNIIGDILSDF